MSNQPPLERYLSTLRSEQSAETYRKGIRCLVGDGNKFLDLVKSDKKGSENFLMDKIISIRDNVSGATCRNYLAAVRSFIIFYEIDLNWLKIRKLVPRSRVVAADRCPTVEEIRKLLNICSVRDRAITLCLLSGGFRVGAFEWLNIGDYSKLESGVGRLVIYRGFPEEYFCFISPEASNVLDDTLVQRKKDGETIKDSSPLFRRVWNIFSSISESRLKRLKVNTIESMFNNFWVKSGVRESGVGKGRRYRQEFKGVHGFRKFFRTRAGQLMNRNDVEYLIGHLSGLDANYYKPEPDYLEKEYLEKAVPLLTISEVEEVKRDSEKKLSLKDQQIDLFERRLSGQDLVLAKIQQRLEEIDSTETSNSNR